MNGWMEGGSSSLLTDKSTCCLPFNLSANLPLCDSLTSCPINYTHSPKCKWCGGIVIFILNPIRNKCNQITLNARHPWRHILHYAVLWLWNHHHNHRSRTRSININVRRRTERLSSTEERKRMNESSAQMSREGTFCPEWWMELGQPAASGKQHSLPPLVRRSRREALRATEDRTAFSQWTDFIQATFSQSQRPKSIELLLAFHTLGQHT